MEDILQRIFGVLLTALVFFILPIYIAYEKIDDVSYALALKITTNFVEDVTNKGYLSRTMYNKFINDLNVTNNVYDIQLEHVAKKYYPVLAVYADDDHKKLIGTYDYNQYKDKYEDSNVDEITFGTEATDIPKSKILVTYKVSEEKIYTSQILDVLDRDFENADDNDAVNRIYGNLDLNTYKNFIGAIDAGNIPTIPAIPTMYQLDTVEGKDRNIYTMNTGDEFNVVIKNKNTTVATVLFNTFTLGGVGANNTRVFVDYGGTIENMDYVNSTQQTITTGDYVNGGKLTVLLDGENNTGSGHILSTKNWYNLIDGTNFNFNELVNFADSALNCNNTRMEIGESYLYLSNDNDFTIELVFAYNSTSGSQTLFSRYPNGGSNAIILSNKGNKNTLSYGPVSSLQDLEFSNDEIIENKIYSLSFTSRDGNIILSQNGISKTTNDSLNLTNSGRSLQIGTDVSAGTGSSTNYFNGRIYCIRIYKDALDDNEIQKNYEVDKSRFAI